MERFGFETSSLGGMVRPHTSEKIGLAMPALRSQMTFVESSDFHYSDPIDEGDSCSLWAGVL